MNGRTSKYALRKQKLNKNFHYSNSGKHCPFEILECKLKQLISIVSLPKLSHNFFKPTCFKMLMLHLSCSWPSISLNPYMLYNNIIYMQFQSCRSKYIVKIAKNMSLIRPKHDPNMVPISKHQTVFLFGMHDSLVKIWAISVM